MLIKLAYQNVSVRDEYLSFLGMARMARSFEDWVDGKRFRNPYTGNEVLFHSLPVRDQTRIREQFAQEKHLPEATKDPDRYATFERMNFRKQAVEDTIKQLNLPLKDSYSDVLDLVGAHLLGGSGAKPRVVITQDEHEGQKGIHVGVYQSKAKSLSRWIGRDAKGKPYIYNGIVEMEDGTAKGAGTKLLIAEVAEASKKGFDRIECLALGDPPQWVGHKVWPKLGYDGVIPIGKAAKHNSNKKDFIPENKFPQKFVDAFKEKGYKAPWRISHLFSIQGGSEWWEKNAVSFYGTFDLKEGSHSMKVLQEYLEKKAKESGKTPEEWSAKIAATGLDSSRWDQFLTQHYQGGKVAVLNPNPKKRDHCPEVSFYTAMKNASFRNQVMQQFRAYVTPES